MNIDSFENVLITCIFIIPGFLVDGIVCLFSPPVKRKEAIHFLYFLLYSVLNCAIWSWSYTLIWPIRECEVTVFLILLCAISILGATILGIVIGLFRKFSLFRKFLNIFGCNINHPIPTAWDYIFSQQIPCYVIIELKDSTVIYGLYDRGSFSSSDDSERDFYVQTVFDVNKNGEWTISVNNFGMYISKDQIKTIKFLQGEDTNEDTKQQ